MYASESLPLEQTICFLVVALLAAGRPCEAQPAAEASGDSVYAARAKGGVRVGFGRASILPREPAVLSYGADDPTTAAYDSVNAELEYRKLEALLKDPVAATTTSADGKFEIDEGPLGRYRLVAWIDVNGNDLPEPDGIDIVAGPQARPIVAVPNPATEGTVRR
jgi:hypothetical protein